MANQRRGAGLQGKARHLLVSLALIIALLMAMGLVEPALAVGPNALRSGFETNTLARNDDGSTGLVGMGFTLNFFGQNYSSLYVNNNGNVTFNSALWTYTPFNLTSTGSVIIAPFFADVDTRSAGDPVRYGTGTVDGRAAFGATYRNVDCYYSSTSRTVRNHFQVIIINRSDIGSGDFDIEFNYDQIQWEAGGASGGTFNCLGGSSARVGWSNGTGAPGTSFEMAGSGVNGAFLDSNLTTGLIRRSLNSAQLGRYLFQVRGGVPIDRRLPSLRLLSPPLPMPTGGTTPMPR